MPTKAYMTLTRAGKTVLFPGGSKGSASIPAGSIEIIGFSFDASETGNERERRYAKPITISKRVDQSSPLFFNTSWTGEFIDEVTIVVVDANRGSLINKITMRRVQIETSEMSFATGGERVQRLVLHYGGIQMSREIAKYDSDAEVR